MGDQHEPQATALDPGCGDRACLGLEGTIDGALNNVVRLAGGGALALCECGLEQTAASEMDAWVWLLDHACAGQHEL